MYFPESTVDVRAHRLCWSAAADKAFRRYSSFETQISACCCAYAVIIVRESVASECCLRPFDVIRIWYQRIDMLELGVVR